VIRFGKFDLPGTAKAASQPFRRVFPIPQTIDVIKRNSNKIKDTISFVLVYFYLFFYKKPVSKEAGFCFFLVLIICLLCFISIYWFQIII
jgi:hypothetical protein